MSLSDCFPKWLQRRSVGQYGPQYEDTIPYPVYQVQPAVVSQDNPNTTAAHIDDSFFQCTAGQIAAANVGTRIVHVMPNNMYDTIMVVAFDNNAVPANNVVVPIMLSMDRPGRITVENPLPQATPEVMLATATAFNPADPSSYPNLVATGIAQPTTFYSTLVFSTNRTNRPFYVWFGDGIALPPSTNANFKIAWFTRGR